MGLVEDPTQSALRAVIACVNRLASVARLAEINGSVGNFESRCR